MSKYEDLGNVKKFENWGMHVKKKKKNLFINTVKDSNLLKGR